MSYSNLKAAISQVVRANGRREITGANLQSVLFGMVDSLGDGYAFKGIATPTYNPGTPDGKVFYLASENGTYTHFGSATLSSEVAIFSYDGSWHKLATGAARSAELTAEVNRASAAEGMLTTAVNSKASASSLNSEIQRATLAEQALGGRIDTEKQRAEGVEGTLTTAVAAKYTKPVAGIPQTDLESGVQSKLNAVAGKYVKPSAGIPETDLDASVRTKLNDRGGDTSLCVHLAGEETITGDKTFAGSADFNADADFYGTPSFNADADIIDDNGETFGLVSTAQAAAGAVRHDVDQSLQLSDQAKSTARQNIEAEKAEKLTLIKEVTLEEAVSYVDVVFTTEQTKIRIEINSPSCSANSPSPYFRLQKPGVVKYPFYFYVFNSTFNLEGYIEIKNGIIKSDITSCAYGNNSNAKKIYGNIVEAGDLSSFTTLMLINNATSVTFPIGMNIKVYSVE